MAKFCHNCGSPLDDGMLFCGSCGAKQDAVPQAQAQPQLQPQSAPQQPVYQQPAPPQPPKKKKTGLIVGLSAAFVAVAALVCAGIFWIYPSFFSPEAKYEKYMDQAETALDAEEFDDAIEAYTKAIELKLDKIEPYIGRGDAHCKAENFEDAIDDYEAALEINEAEADIYVKIANAYVELEDTDAALKVLNDGLDATEGDDDIQDLLDELDPPLLGNLGSAVADAVEDVLPPEINEALSGVGTVIEDSIGAITLPDDANADIVSGIPAASDNTAAAIGNTFAASPYAALADFIVALVDGQLSAAVDMADDEHSLSAQAELRMELAQLRASLHAYAAFDGQSLEADAYIGEDGAAVHAPIVDGNWYGVTWATLLDDLENSIFVEQGMIYPEDISYMREQIDMLEAQIASLEESALPVFSDVDLGRYVAILMAVSPEIFTGTDDDRDYMTVSVPFDAVMYALRDIFAELSTDAAIAEIYAYICELEGYDYNSSVAEWSEMMEYAAADLDMVAAELEGSADITIYTANGYIDSIVIELDPTVDGETVFFNILLDFDYANDMLCAASLLLNGSDGWDDIFCYMSYGVSSEGAIFSDCLNFEYNDGYDSGNLSIATEWNRETGDLAFYMTSDNGYYTDSIEMPFQLRSVGAGSELSVDTYELTGVEGRISLTALPGNPSVNRPNSWIGIEDWDEDLFEKLEDAMYELEGMFGGGYEEAAATPAQSYGTGTALP